MTTHEDKLPEFDEDRNSFDDLDQDAFESPMISHSQVPTDHPGAPVLAVTNSFRRWQRLKWPLVFAVSLAFIFAIGYVVYLFVLDKHIENAISGARQLEVDGEFEQLEAAEKVLVELFKENPTRDEVRTAYAWNSFLLGELMGTNAKYHQNLQAIIGQGDREKNRDGLLAQGVLDFVKGDYAQALKGSELGASEYPGEPRFAILHAFALAKNGKARAVFDYVASQRKIHPEYRPLFLFDLDFAFKNGNTAQNPHLVKELLDRSVNHVWGKLWLISNQLPKWGDPPAPKEQIDPLVTALEYLKKEYTRAHPKIQQAGRYLEARLALAQGRVDGANVIFAKLVDKNPEVYYVAWYGHVLFLGQGPNAALEMLKKHPQASSQAILELEALCLLSHHRVDDAAKIVKSMEEASDFEDTSSVRVVKWLLATRSGHIKTAMTLLPRTIHKPYQWGALELYWQLKNLGNTQGIERVARSLKENFFTCSETILAWHGRRVKKVMRKHTSPKNAQNSCVNALAAHSMRTYLPMPLTQEAAKIATKGAGDQNAWIETDRAVLQWMTSGAETGKQILAEVLARKPQGTPLRYQIARSYLEMNLPDKAYELVSKCDKPQEIDICINSLRALDKNREADALIKKAVAKSKNKKHPALYPFRIYNQLKNAPDEKAISAAKKLSSSAGAWSTASVRQIVASLSKDKEMLKELERYLLHLPTSVAKTAGQDAYWKANEIAVQYFLGRGTKYYKQARIVIAPMQKRHLFSPWFCYGLGLVQIDKKNEDSAEKWFDRALKHDPTFVPAYQGLKKIKKLTPEMKTKLGFAHPEIAI